MDFTRANLVDAVSVLAILYWVGLVVYRLYLSPIASIPGPKLAAATKWYETYFELFKSPTVGQFTFHFRELHKKYGPIIRLGPNEVHVQDSEFFHQIYSQKQPWDKPKYLQHRFGIGNGLLSTPSHGLHRNRRLAVNPFFSTKAIHDVSPHIQARMDKICERLGREYKKTGKVLRLDWMFGCYAADNVIAYCLENGYDWIDAPDFCCGFTEFMNRTLENTHLATQFPLVGKILGAVPKRLLAKLDPQIMLVEDLEQAMARQIAHLISKSPSENVKPQRKTVFRALLESDLPPEEVSPTRLTHEAMTIIGGGVETVRGAMALGSFHILDNPAILDRLQKELKQAIPDPSVMPPLESLERLPYLDACVQESLRMIYGIVQRLHRVSDHISLRYGSYVIPPGVVVSMDIYSVAHDEKIFPDSYTFAPERWLNDPRAPDGKSLSSYMVSFGRGTRQCLGKPMALAEMHIAMASLLRRFDLELFETDRTAVDCAYDVFSPRPKPGTKGVRVRVV